MLPGLGEELIAPSCRQQVRLNHTRVQRVRLGRSDWVIID